MTENDDQAEINETPELQPSNTGFERLLLSADVLTAVAATGYTNPTPIQSEIIPHMLNGRDVLAQSQTGTGKTAAFALPILSKINLDKRRPQVLVLTPTRELAIQVAEFFSKYASSLERFGVATIYGGQEYATQFKQLRSGVQVVVGTPGRVIDHVKRGTLDLGGIDCLVLDEADEMLNMGFLEDVEFVLKQAPKDRQIALFSATLPKQIRNIADRYLIDPARITVKAKTMTADSIRQRAVFVSARNKVDVLTRFLEAEETDGVLVFTKTKDATVTVAEKLSSRGLSVAALNGDMPQRNRERTIERLKAGNLNIVVATDVAARGLDVTRVSHVFNYDLPDGNESYVHRIGRTGRAGRKGEAIIFFTKTQGNKLRQIERTTKQPIEVVKPPTIEMISEKRLQRFKQQISQVALNEELSKYSQLLTDYAKQTELPMEVIAAALARMVQKIDPFFPEYRAERKNTKGVRSHGANTETQSEPDDFESGTSGRFATDSLGPPEHGMNRFRISVGRRDGVKPGNIVGAVANEAGIDGADIGPIKIHGSFSTIDLPDGMPKDIHELLQKTRVAGRQLRLRLASDEPEGKSRRQKHRSNDKSRGTSKRKHDASPRAKSGGKRKKQKLRV